MLNMQDALLPPSLPPIAPRRPLCCSCSFGTPRPAPEFESRGERERLSAFSLSYVRSRVPAFHAPAPGRSGDAAGLRTNMYKHRTLHNSALAPARFGIRPSSTATGARQHNAGGRGGWGGGAGRAVAVFEWSQVPRAPCVPSLFVNDPSVVCAAGSHAAEIASAVTDARVTTTPKGLNLGAGLVPGGRGRAAADGERSAAANRGHHSMDRTARAAEFSSRIVCPTHQHRWLGRALGTCLGGLSQSYPSICADV